MNKKYYAAAGGFILGQYYTAGEPVVLSEDQAKYLAPPIGDAVTTAAPKPAGHKAKARSGESAK